MRRGCGPEGLGPVVVTAQIVAGVQRGRRHFERGAGQRQPVRALVRFPGLL